MSIVYAVVRGDTGHAVDLFLEREDAEAMLEDLHAGGAEPADVLELALIELDG